MKKTLPISLFFLFTFFFLLTSCQNQNSSRRYVSNDPTECAAMRFICEDNEFAFFDDTGCGCEDNVDGGTEDSDMDDVDVGDNENDPENENSDTSDENTGGGNEEAEILCTQEYKPVCGMQEVQCIKAPCNPVPVTYSNLCMAQQAGAKNIKEGGTCEELGIEPTE